MHEVYVEDIEWKRVHVTLRGRIEPVDPGTPVDLDLLVLENTRTDEQILLPPATVVGDTWFVRFNSMQVCEQYPLAIGDWRLCYPDANDYLVPVRMDADLSISGFAYGGLFSYTSGQRQTSSDDARLVLVMCAGFVTHLAGRMK